MIASDIQMLHYWGNDIGKIFVDGAYSELFLSAEDDWKPVLK